MSSDPVILDYGDSALRLSDMSLLDPPCWLNDRLIAFALERLEREEFAGAGVGCVSPDVVQLVQLGEPADLAPCLEPLGLAGKKVLLLPVNDHTDRASVGGTHWSLLAVRPEAGVALHLDSMQGGNYSAAYRVGGKLAPLLGLETLKVCEPKVVPPQQENCYDCGAYVVAFAARVARDVARGKWEPCLGEVTPSVVSRERRELKELIESMGRAQGRM